MELEFGDKLGKGLFGEVWSAVSADGRSVAVKFIHGASPTEAEKFALDHARALARVHHPRVVRILSVDQHTHPGDGERKLAVVMDRLHGVTLEEVEEIDEFDAAQIALDILDGVDAVHAAGLIHGDLHAGNVMVVDGRATLIDILYTRSLAEISASARVRDRDQDIRESIQLIRRALDLGKHPTATTERIVRDCLTDPRTIARARKAVLRGLVRTQATDAESGTLRRPRRLEGLTIPGEVADVMRSAVFELEIGALAGPASQQLAGDLFNAACQLNWKPKSRPSVIMSADRWTSVRVQAVAGSAAEAPLRALAEWLISIGVDAYYSSSARNSIEVGDID